MSQNRISELVLELCDVMHRLRKECPWDQEQDLSSLRKYLLEEAQETLAAMNALISHGESSETLHDLVEELGDLFLQILFQTELLQEKFHLPIRELMFSKLKEKLIRRHPHVFGEVKLSDANEVLKQWDQIKRQEKEVSETKAANAARRSKLAEELAKRGKGLSALQRAEKIGVGSEKIKFDWANSAEVWKHFELEIEELKSAHSPQEKEHELGDLLFCLAQWARHEGLDSEVALHSANDRFLKRFRKMMELTSDEDFLSLPMESKEELWQKAKKALI